MKLEIGLVHYHFGRAPGKTTSTFGVVTRAVGHGMRPYIIQFLKKNSPDPEVGFDYGEYHTLVETLGVPVEQFGKTTFITDRGHPDPRDIERSAAGLERAREVLSSGEYDLVVLDEIVDAVSLGHFRVADVVELLRDRPRHVEVMITGHERYDELVEVADYVTEFKPVKHPYQHGVLAREGIEY
ncbi:MAG: cob(I)yrinic acid a,c-diamide adenosyltransferase [Promethearchaeota archaeon]